MIRLTVHAGNHDREHCPVFVDLDPSQLAHDTPAAVYAVDDNGKLIFGAPAQNESVAAKTRLHFIVDRLARGESRTFEMRTGEQAIAVMGACTIVQLHDHPGQRVDVLVGGRLFTSYQHAASQVRPFLHPLLGPNGLPMTRELEGDKSQGFDHPHHRSFYIAHGDVNGSDNWSEEPGHGWVRHRKFVALKEGPVFAELVAVNDWLNKDEQPLLAQTTRLRLYNTPKNARIIDKSVIFDLAQGDVRFGDTKEGGLLSVRMNPSMTGQAGGMMTNSYGAKGEAEIWGKRAHWLDYSGPLGNDWCGLAMFDTPGNFRYPTYWHARDYGLATANPFGLSDYFGTKEVDGSHTFAGGGNVTFRYRLLIHAGDCEAARVGERYHDYVNPPQVTAL